MRPSRPLLRPWSAGLAALLAGGCGFVGGESGADHDDDGVADELDGCPHLASAQQLDQDGDGVGDECDPGPGPHYRVLFEGFEGAPSGELWEVAGGGQLADWVVVKRAGGSYVQQSSVAGGRRQLRLRTPVVQAAIATRVLVDTLVDTAGARGVGLVLGDLSAIDSSSYGLCAARRVDAGDGLTGGFYTGDDVVTESSVPLAAPLTDGALLLGGQHQASGKVSCEARFGAGPVARADAERAGRGERAQLGLHTAGAAALFDYVFVVAPR